MTVKNIMFSGVMAAILMAGANAHAAVEIASKKYVDTEVAKKADGEAFTALKNAVESTTDGLATKASKAELTEGLELKANAADVYTKDDADAKFETIVNVTAGLEEQQGYTDAKVKALLDSLGSAGGEGGEGATGLQATVAGNTSRIVTLETKVGEKNVATQISEALSAYTNSENLAKDYLTKTDAQSTYGLKADVTANTNAISVINNAETGLLAQAAADATAKADKALDDAKAYTDEKVTDMATNSSVDTKLTEYTKTTDLNTTFATDSEVTGVKTELEGKIDAKVATADYNAKVQTLETSIASNKTATETNATAIQNINDSDVMKSGITEAKRIAYDNAVTELANKITMPDICQSKNCVLSTLDGVPTWVEITIPVGE